MGESAVLKIVLRYNLRRQCRFDGKTKTKIECTPGLAAKGALVGKKLYNPLQSPPGFPGETVVVFLFQHFAFLYHGPNTYK